MKKRTVRTWSHEKEAVNRSGEVVWYVWLSHRLLQGLGREGQELWDWISRLKGIWLGAADSALPNWLLTCLEDRKRPRLTTIPKVKTNRQPNPESERNGHYSQRRWTRLRKIYCFLALLHYTEATRQDVGRHSVPIPSDTETQSWSIWGWSNPNIGQPTCMTSWAFETQTESWSTYTSCFYIHKATTNPRKQLGRIYNNGLPS